MMKMFVRQVLMPSLNLRSMVRQVCFSFCFSKHNSSQFSYRNMHRPSKNCWGPPTFWCSHSPDRHQCFYRPCKAWCEWSIVIFTLLTIITAPFYSNIKAATPRIVNLLHNSDSGIREAAVHCLLKICKISCLLVYCNIFSLLIYWIALLTPETLQKYSITATSSSFLKDIQPYLTSELLSLCLRDDRLALVSVSASLFALFVTSGECLIFLIFAFHYISWV